MEITARRIIDRLIEARKAAGLSQTQAAKLLGWSAASTLSQVEGDYRTTEPSLSMFLKMCDIYGISPIWALTGCNPDFDERAFNQMISNTNIIFEDAMKLRDTLERITTARADDADDGHGEG